MWCTIIEFVGLTDCKHKQVFKAIVSSLNILVQACMCWDNAWRFTLQNIENTWATLEQMQD